MLRSASSPAGRALLLLLVVVLTNAAEAQEAGPNADATKPAETSVEERLARAFARIPAFADVEVDVADGVVRLTGTVESREEIDRAVELAGKLNGVLFVDEDLETSTDVAGRVLPSADDATRWAQRAGRRLPLIGVALLVFLLFVFGARVVRRADLSYGPLRTNRLLRELSRQSLAVAIFVLGLVVALRILGLGYLVGGLLGGAGVVGLAVGFAFRDILENYLASILLSFRRPFRSMDLVDVDGTLGTVLRMTSSQTILMTPDGNHVRLPNSTVFKGRVTNFTENPLRRFDFVVGIGNSVELVTAMRLGRETLEQMTGIADDPRPMARVEELGDSAVVVRYFAWVHQKEVDFGKARSEAVRLVKAALDEAGIDLPVPIYQIDLRRSDAGGEQPRDDHEGRPPGVPNAPDPQAADVAPEQDAVERRMREEALADGGDNLLRS